MATPRYVELARSGALEERIASAARGLAECRLCPHACGVDRTAGETGRCRAGAVARVFRHMAHPGEEPPISGRRGSGVIFASHCTMSCCYCQNYRMSQLDEGTDRSPAEIAGMMRALADAGCHNLNLVSATQFLPAFLEALRLAARDGVRLPVVWNTSSYECAGTLALLDGVVDVYLADLRYTDPEAARLCSAAPDYVAVSRGALLEMKRQVGDLVLDANGLAVRGLIVRHLVLPSGLSGTAEAMRFVARELGTRTAVSLMSQYYPAWRACDVPGLGRRLTREEWEGAVLAFEEAGLSEGWIQDLPEGLSPIAGTEIAPDHPRRRDR
jgi:putative pyruvate formate lyase activating enzyme